MADRAITIRKGGASNRSSDAGLASRMAAAEILFRVETEAAFADVLLGNRLMEFKPEDRRLITMLVLGTLAWMGRLDYELGKLTGRKLDTIQPAALSILRMGLFQLRFLDRVPQHAVVDTAVSLAKRVADARKASGFVNAVMRRATRETVKMPDRARDEVAYLSIVHSHPRWMVERFIEWFGVANAEKLMAANNTAAPNAIRLNLSRGSRAEILERLHAEGFELGAGGHALETIVLKSAAIFDSPAYNDGLFHAQSEASQMVVRMLGAKAGARVLDCAAAPGGKTTHLAEMVAAKGRVVAADINPNGLRNARELARRLRHRNIDFVRADASAALPFRDSSFDSVLLDAPCTGIGTLREHPEIRWRLAPDDSARMASLQSRMLENAAAMVRSGGAIVYSVCSIAPEEGNQVVDVFLKSHTDFEVDSHPPNFDEMKDVLDERVFMKTRPDLGGLDGFFAARLVRKK